MPRPKCPKCSGWLMADYDVPFARVPDAIRCVICGHRIYRNFSLRKPTVHERRDMRRKSGGVYAQD